MAVAVVLFRLLPVVGNDKGICQVWSVLVVNMCACVCVLGGGGIGASLWGTAWASSQSAGSRLGSCVVGGPG